MSEFAISKRSLLMAGAGALAGLGATAARAAPAGPVTVLLESEVVILDPHVTTAAITRTFGYHVWDTLFSMDSAGAIKPQMVKSWETAPDGKRWRFVLRDRLQFHDGAPVTAADCVATLQRWSKLDALGRRMVAAGAVFAADGTDAFTITLDKPFPLMLDVLGKPNAPVPFIMPARVIAAAGTGRIKDIVGSGPFTFATDQWRPGDSMVLRRFANYVPRAEKPDFLSGGKVVHLDQVVLRAINDNATGATALIAGEIDYMQYLPYEFVDKLKKTADVRVISLGGLDMFQGNFRPNAASGPFADPAVRAVLWKLVNQADMLDAAGIDAEFRIESCPAFFMCGTPLESAAGAQSARYDLAAAKAELSRTAYRGEPVIMLQVSGSISQAAGTLLAETMRKAGFTVDEQVMDWGTVLARRAKREGWSLFPVYSNGVDMASPLNHFYIANNCADYPGWSCSTVMTDLLAQFVDAPDEAARKALAAKIQEEAYRSTPSVMWGQFARPAGYRARLTELIPSSFPMFWNVKLAGS